MDIDPLHIDGSGNYIPPILGVLLHCIVKKRTQEKGGIYGRGESSTATVHAPSPIRRPLNPGGRTPQQKLQNAIYLML